MSAPLQLDHVPPDRVAHYRALRAEQRALAAELAARYRHDPVAWVRNVLGEHMWSMQAQIMRSVVSDRLVAVQSAHGVGKALALDTPLPTPTGWIIMADASPGTALLDEQGKACTVTAVSPVQHRPTFRVRFDDGSVITASDDHQWQVQDVTRRPRGVRDWREHWAATTVRTTAELAATLRTGVGQLRWRVPTARPLAGVATALPVPPYTLGVWLGDGTTVQAAFTAAREDAVHTLAHIHAEGVTTRVRQSSVRDNCACYGLLGQQVKLRALGVLGAKHVPAAVLRADADTRLAVLQGLMDTDGFVQTGQSVGIDLCDRRLADGVAELVVSLGWKAYRSTKPATLNGRVVGTVYRLNFRPDRPVFRLPRKAARLGRAVGQASRHTQRTIVAVEPVPTVPTRCVTVDAPSRLYLAGESMIPTHNSFLASRLVLWFLATRPADKTVVVTSAPTAHQVRAVLWRYIRQGHQKGGLPGIITQGQVPEWKIDGHLVGYGRRPADHQQSAFQGLHADHLLIVLDEAGGIPKWLWDASDSLITGSEGQHLLAIGNPDDNSAHFHTVCTTERNWRRFKISAFDAPWNTGEPVPDELARVLVSREWVEDKRARWGETNPLWQAKVLGEFVDSEDGLIPLSWVSAAHQRWHAWDEAGRPERGRRIIGVDVARYGVDATVLAVREGDVVRELHRHVKQDTVAVTTLVQAQLRWPASTSVVDVIGVGAGVVDLLRHRRCSVLAFNAAAKAHRRDVTGQWRFPNVRSASWWNLRELLDPARGATLALPPDDDLTADLITPQWRIGTGNTLIVESKDEIRKRLGRSTDAGDAVCMAMWTPSADIERSEVPRRPAAVAYVDGVTWS